LGTIPVRKVLIKRLAKVCKDWDGMPSDFLDKDIYWSKLYEIKDLAMELCVEVGL